MTRIALIEPLGDPGIGTYTHELAEALTDVGVHVDVYTNGKSWCATRLTRRHRIFPVLGTALIRQRAALRSPLMARAQDAGWAPTGASRGTGTMRRRGVRGSYLSLELAGWLRAMDYDLVWTQWPLITEGALSFWSAARALGLRVVHTAHNILPHERRPGDVEPYRAAYRRSQAIVVHSRAAEATLLRAFPKLATNVVVAPHGLYTAYERQPEARQRLRNDLGLGADDRLVLCFGGIRPYKNLEAVIGALATAPANLHLLVAGRESGYPDSSPENPLGRTRRLVDAAQLNGRVHLRVGPFAYRQTAEFFEAADIVVLPYLEGYGSGVLLLAMTFGRHIVATPVGGAQEYLQHYPRHHLTTAPTSTGVRDALQRAAAEMIPESPASRPIALEWRNIVTDLLPRLLDVRA